MEFLHSNFPPVRQGKRDFLDVFYDLLKGTESLDIAVGYITSESLVELERLTELNNLKHVNLTIGMHYWDKFTHIQYETALHLNNYLKEREKGEVRLVTPFRYHGKMYSYSDSEGAFAGIIGSNNLGSIVESRNRIYESAILMKDRAIAGEMKKFIDLLVSEATDNIAELDIRDFNTQNTLLEGHENVQRVSGQDLAEYKASLTSTSFEIPIKTYEDAPQSNLNVYFGKGRSCPNGIIRPRHWYEVELIVPKNVTTQVGYPGSRTQEAEFQVITDDGWTFRCKVSGDYNKNFRSEGDLKILGRWLKGRLENNGALVVGSPVTKDTLKKYGRDTFTLTKTTKPGVWYLDFGVD